MHTILTIKSMSVVFFRSVSVPCVVLCVGILMMTSIFTCVARHQSVPVTGRRTHPVLRHWLVLCNFAVSIISGGCFIPEPHHITCGITLALTHICTYNYNLIRTLIYRNIAELYFGNITLYIREFIAVFIESNRISIS